LIGFPFLGARRQYAGQPPFFISFLQWDPAVYLLYLDESGNPDDPADRNFVLGGVAVFERQTYFLSSKLDEVQTKHFPGIPPLEFHASDIRSGKGFWRGVERERKTAVLRDISNVLASANDPGVILFGAVIEKNAAVYGEEAVRLATEQVCKRFDTFLARQYQEHNNPQRGLLVFAESHYKHRAKVWVRGFRQLGTQWGVLRNLSDIPYFASTKETRLLQLADFVAHSIFLLYERNDDSLSKIIVSRFDQKDGVLHGLVHVSDARAKCPCPACLSRRTR
jgi:hypothetical protein